METITSRQNKTVREAAALLSSAEERPAAGGVPLRGGPAVPGRGPLRRGDAPLLCHGPGPGEVCRVPAAGAGAPAGRPTWWRTMWPGCFPPPKAPRGFSASAAGPRGLLAGRRRGRASCAVLEDLAGPGQPGHHPAHGGGPGRLPGVLLGDCCDPLSPKALRASMGAVFRLGLWLERSGRGLCSRLREQGFRLLASVPDSAALPVTQVDFSQGTYAVFIGNEGNGLTQETISQCRRVTIPMAGRAESLNASAAATILLWEMARAAGKGGSMDNRAYWIWMQHAFGAGSPTALAHPPERARRGGGLLARRPPAVEFPGGHPGAGGRMPCTPFPWRRPRPSWSMPCGWAGRCSPRSVGNIPRR